MPQLDIFHRVSQLIKGVPPSNRRIPRRWKRSTHLLNDCHMSLGIAHIDMSIRNYLDVMESVVGQVVSSNRVLYYLGNMSHS